MNEGLINCSSTNWDVFGWVNIATNGNYHGWHNHGSFELSGVYYVTPGRGPGGALELLMGEDDQILVHSLSGHSGTNLESFRTEFVTPEAGLMLIFPGNLYHRVVPYEGHDNRISIAFNGYRMAQVS